MEKNQAARLPAIAYIAQTFPALTQTFVYREVDQLRALGYSLITSAIWKPKTDTLSAESRHHVDGSFYVFPIHWPRFIQAHMQTIAKHPWRYIATLFFVVTRHGETVQNRLRTFYQFLEAVSLLPDFKKNGVVHIHAHFSINAATIALILSRLLKITFSFTAHNIFFTDRILLKEKVESARFIAAISGFSKQYLLDLVPGNNNTEKIHIVHCGLSPDEFSSRKSLRRNQAPILLFLAQLEERKGAKYLVEACRLLGESDVDYECILIGDGPQRDELKALINNYGLEEKIQLMGALPQEDLKDYFIQADIFILPCVIARDGDMDGVPVSLMEAMAMEMPVISTRVSGIPELIIDGESGLLVDHSDAKELSSAILKMINNQDLRLKLGGNARQRIIEEFNIYRTSTEMGGLFSKYLDSANEYESKQ